MARNPIEEKPVIFPLFDERPFVYETERKSPSQNAASLTFMSHKKTSQLQGNRDV
jgi:hypothetical protein